MSRHSTTLAGLMAGLVAIGLGVAALRNASATWAKATLLGTLVLLALAVAGCMIRRGGRRAWWVGFALSGGLYAALAIAPWSMPALLPTSGWLEATHRRVMPSTHLEGTVTLINIDGQGIVTNGSDSLLFSREELAIKRFIPGDGYASVGGEIAAIGGLTITDSPGHFVAIGHCLLTLIAGLVGAVVARRYHDFRWRASTTRS